MPKKPTPPSSGPDRSPTFQFPLRVTDSAASGQGYLLTVQPPTSFLSPTTPPAPGIHVPGFGLSLSRASLESIPISNPSPSPHPWTDGTSAGAHSWPYLSFTPSPVEVTTYVSTLQLWEHAAQISAPMKFLVTGIRALPLLHAIRVMDWILRHHWIDEIIRTNAVPRGLIEFLFQRAFLYPVPTATLAHLPS